MKTIWIAAAETAEYGRVYLHDYAAHDAHNVGVKIMDGARREGFTGTLQDRLANLGWEIVCLRVEELP